MSNTSSSEDEVSSSSRMIESATFVAIGVISFISSSLACIVMNKTKRVPYAAKFLSQGLLTFDCMFVVTVTSRRLVSDQTINNQLQVISTCLMQLTYTTVGMMSVERFVLFNWPEVYMRRCTKRLVRVLSASIWTGASVAVLLVRYGVCFLKFRSTKVFNEPGFCNGIVTLYYIAFISSVLTIASVSYWKIFAIIRSKSSTGQGTASFRSAITQLRKYKSTSLVLVYVLVILATSVAYLSIVMIIQFFSVTPRIIRLTLDTVTIFNCILDPYLYAFWFRESRMECLKIMSIFNKTYLESAESLRMEIYDIVTTEFRKNNNRVHPLHDDR